MFDYTDKVQGWKPMFSSLRTLVLYNVFPITIENFGQRSAAELLLTETSNIRKPLLNEKHLVPVKPELIQF